MIPCVIIGIFSVAIWDFSILKSKNFYLGILAFLGIVLPWHLIESVRFGWGFWDQYFFYHILSRYTQAIENNGRGALFYWDIFHSQKILFYSLLISTVYFFGKLVISRKKSYGFILLSSAFIYILFTFSSTKLPAYILVFYPIAFIMIGGMVNDIFLAFFSPIVVKYISYLTVASTVVIIISLVAQNDVKTARLSTQELFDSRQVGLFLRENYLNLPIYYLSQAGTKPSIIFYSGRVVYMTTDPYAPHQPFLLVNESGSPIGFGKMIFETNIEKLSLID